MTDQIAVHESHIPALTLLARGKVRDIYAVDDERLLIVTTDRISAFDVVLPDPIPGKGALLTRSRTSGSRDRGIVANHLTGIGTGRGTGRHRRSARQQRDAGREAPDNHCRQRPWCAAICSAPAGPITSAGGRSAALQLPPGLQQAEQLAQPLFTPATKAAVGDHDENISFEALRTGVIGSDGAKVRDLAIALYQHGAAYAAERGIIIADTKFEFATGRRRTGLDRRGAHAGLVTLLAGRRVPPWAPARRASTSSSCATICPASTGTARRRPRRCPRR
jgi:phosphoribosylaminoimidazole-succinocarboxamide synthase